MDETGLLTRNPWVARRKLDVWEYHRMGEFGIFGEGDRVELIEGELVAMSPIYGPHIGAVIALSHLLVAAAGDRALVSVQNPVRLGDRSEPQPDVVLLRPRTDGYRLRAPGPEDVLLLIEVADSSLRYDRAVKLPLYARHGIPEVWIVDIAANTVEWFRYPEGEAYAATDRAVRGATLVPALLPEVPIPVTAILG